MLEARRSRNRPRAGQGRFIPQEGVEIIRVGMEGNRAGLDGRRVRDPPRFRRVGEIAVGQQHDRGHVFGRDPGRLDGDLEAIGGRLGGDDRERAVRVSAIDRLMQVGLFGLRRHAGRWARALDVDHHEGQFHGDGEADGFGLERDARAGTRRHAEITGIGRADGRADGGDLVLGLEGDDAEFLQTRKRVKHR